MKLIRPNEEYLDSYRDAFIEENEESLEESFEDPEVIIEVSKNYEEGIHMKPGYVKATTFWLVDEEQFIGTINIRHELTHFLLNYGGHIGYKIRLSRRRKGYATKMLSMALAYCRNELKIQDVLITCDDDNIASAKVIENNGGVLENLVCNTIDGKTFLTRRYWIYG